MGCSCRTFREEPLCATRCFPNGALQNVAPNPYMRVPETPPLGIRAGFSFLAHDTRLRLPARSGAFL
jgi:hypothetical protein